MSESEVALKDQEAQITIEERIEPVDKGLDRISNILDQAIRIPGTNIRIGLDPIIGFIAPFAGDSITALMSVYIVIASIRYGLPKGVIARMVFNIGVDYALGSIPVIGDIFDFAWKANTMNMKLLNKYGSGDRRSSWSDWAWLFILLGALGALIFGLVAITIYAIHAVGMKFI